MAVIGKTTRSAPAPPPFRAIPIANPTVIREPILPSGSGTSVSSGSPSSSASGGLPGGIFPIEFSFVNLTGTGGPTQMQRVLALSGGTPQSTAISFTAPFKGFIVALTLASTAAKSAGSATFNVYREAAAVTNCKLTWATNADSAIQTFQLGQFPFSAGDSLDVRFTTSSFTPTTADVEVFLYLQQQVT